MRILHDYNVEALEEQLNDFFKLKCRFDMMLSYFSEVKSWHVDDAVQIALEDISDQFYCLHSDLEMTLERILRAFVPPEAEENVEVFFSPKETPKA